MKKVTNLTTGSTNEKATLTKIGKAEKMENKSYKHEIKLQTLQKSNALNPLIIVFYSVCNFVTYLLGYPSYY